MKDVKQYLAALPPEARRSLQKLRAAVRAAIPGGKESLSYGILVLKVDDRPVIYYAAWKAHCSLYPMSAAVRKKYARDLTGFETSKGTIRFPMQKLPPAAVVKRLARARLAEFRAKE